MSAGAIAFNPVTNSYWPFALYASDPADNRDDPRPARGRYDRRPASRIWRRAESRQTRIWCVPAPPVCAAHSSVIPGCIHARACPNWHRPGGMRLERGEMGEDVNTYGLCLSARFEILLQNAAKWEHILRRNCTLTFSPAFMCLPLCMCVRRCVHTFLITPTHTNTHTHAHAHTLTCRICCPKTFHLHKFVLQSKNI